MKRRQFIKLAGGIWLTNLTETALGQSKRKPKVGYLSATSAPDFNVESFKFGMSSAGFEQGREYDLEVRYGAHSRLGSVLFRPGVGACKPRRDPCPVQTPY